MEHLLNKRVKVIFDDGNHVTIKVGMLNKIDGSFLFLDSEAISLSRIIRIEVTSA